MEVTEFKDIDSSTSTEDIQAYAEQVVNEVEADRAGDDEPAKADKSDAQITNEQASTPQPSDKEPEQVAASDTSDESAADGETTSETEEEDRDWLTDDVKAEATAYGIDESELADFANREEYERALRLFDKSALEAGRKAMAEGEGSGPARNEKGQFVKKEPEPGAEPPKEEAPKDGQFQVGLDTDLYDEELVSTLTRMRDHYDSRLEAIEAQFAAEAAKVEEQRFDSFVDSLGHADLFGKTGKESKEELAKREDLLIAVKAQMIGLEGLGRPVEMSDQLVKRVANMVFAEELSKKQLKAKTQKVSKQSDRRQGGSPVKPIPPSDDPREEAARLYKELEQS